LGSVTMLASDRSSDDGTPAWPMHSQCLKSSIGWPALLARGDDASAAALRADLSRASFAIRRLAHAAPFSESRSDTSASRNASKSGSLDRARDSFAW
jgi:hypothetical protein